MPLRRRRAWCLVAASLAVGGCEVLVTTDDLAGGADALDAAPPPAARSGDAALGAPNVIGSSPVDASLDARAARDADAAGDAAIADTSPPPPSHTADGGALPGPPPASCSLSSSTAATLVVQNTTFAPIELWWVDYACNEEPYGDVAPSSSVTLGTYVTHPWRLRAPFTHALLRDVPPIASAGTTTVTYP